MAIVETESKFHAVQLGEMIRVGEVWKLTQVPQPIEGDKIVSNGGILMEPLLIAGESSNTPAPSPKVEKILDRVARSPRTHAIDAEPENTTPAQVKSLMAKRRVLMSKEAIELAESDEEKIDPDEAE